MTVAVSPVSARVEQLRSLLDQARALIFDVDGTLAETEELHRQAFNEAFARAGMNWHWGQAVYKDLLRVAGGKERIRAFDQLRKSGRPLLDGDIGDLHRIKTGCFGDLVAKQGRPPRDAATLPLAGTMLQLNPAPAHADGGCVAPSSRW